MGDKTFHVRWIAPLKGNEKAHNLNLAFEKNRRIALEAARDKGIPTMTSPVNLVQGGKGLLIYIPIFINKEFEGFILAVFKIKQWLDYVFSLNTTKAVKEHFKIAVQFDDDLVYAYQGWDKSKYTDWKAESNITILDRLASVSVVPTEGFFEDKSTSTPEIVAATGILLSTLVAIMIFLLQKTNVAILKEHNINITLEKNIKKRKRAENKAKKSNQAKSEFLSSMSHELRTPINAILGFSQLIEIAAEDDLTKENIREVINAGNHLLELINEVLDLSTIESGNIELSIASHNFNKLLTDCLSIIKPAADKQSILIINNVHSLSDISINVDKRRFKQVLLNLLSNAIKYNSKSGKIIIDCSTIEGNMLCLSITDTGKGLTAAQKNNLFKPFERLGAERTHIEGTGLGLIISKDLIELMGGTIGVESEVGKGSRFWIQVPLS